MDTNACQSSPPTKVPCDFDSLVLPLRSDLYGTAMRYTHSASDADDLVQDTLVRAYGAWERFEPGSNCRAWLFRILTNSFINGYRKRKHHRRFTQENHDDACAAVFGDVEARCQSPRKVMVEECLGDEVSAALESLGDDYRQVVEMADLGGQRYRDIAGKLGVPIGTVMSRLYRARRQLESLLRDYAAADYGIRRAELSAI
ncbi:MAG: sigma-70 family RNA polymerase sigma factor [Myxococcales bacterium]|nr:sigma-70 family RNA polymerase sigma factor [Myxococcales bacterium]